MTITFKISNVKKEKIEIKEFELNKLIRSLTKQATESDTEYPDYDQLVKSFEKSGKSPSEGRDCAYAIIDEWDAKFNDKITEVISKKQLISSIETTTREDGNNCIKLKEGSSNSFIRSAWGAYNNHWNLSIRPDDVWWSIINQFSFYLNKNHELLRDKFVDFQEGKKEIQIIIDKPITEIPINEITNQFVNKISNNIKDPLVKDWIIPSFSTTTSNDKIAFSIALMAISKEYFSYSFRSRCGLPQVTLNGTVEDWVNLKERIVKLLQYNIEETNEIKRWVDYLLPVADKLIESSQGNPDCDWWNKIVDYRAQSGGSVLTGWLSVFCVFNESGVFNDDEPMHMCLNKEKGIYPIVSSSIPDGYLSAPIKLIDANGVTYSTTEIYAGHFGSLVDQDQTIISPSIDWLMLADLKQ